MRVLLIATHKFTTSGTHALLVGDVLAHAGALVNGSTIRRETGMPEMFTCYLELADHALILANGGAAETFIDNAGRNNFDNLAEHAALFPGGRATQEMPRPRALSARQVPMAVRRLLEDRPARLGEAVSQAA